MPGWIFVTLLLAAVALVAAIADRPTWLVGVVAAAALVSLVAGAIARPDRRP